MVVVMHSKEQGEFWCKISESRELMAGDCILHRHLGATPSLKNSGYTDKPIVGPSSDRFKDEVEWKSMICPSGLMPLILNCDSAGDDRTSIHVFLGLV